MGTWYHEKSCNREPGTWYTGSSHLFSQGVVHGPWYHENSCNGEPGTWYTAVLAICSPRGWYMGTWYHEKSCNREPGT